jgi:gas vesicle protein
LQQQQQAYADGTNQITAAQNQSTINQINNLKQLELASTVSFGAVFSSLVSKFESSFNTSILESFTKKLTENLGRTLITPSAKDLQVSPEQQAAQAVAAALSGAGDSLAAQIRQAGLDFYQSVLGGSTVTQVTATSIASLDTATATTVSQVLISAATLAGIKLSNAGSTPKIGGAGISGSTAGFAAIASLAGGLISGSTAPTSTVGQGVGSALSGAATGALIGSVIPGIGTLAGGLIGGGIGLLSGILGASKAQKELQEQQLEQQKEQTALLQASLAYTSQIIGRDTANGIVTSTSINAQGQLVAQVSGNTLQFILSRANQTR